MKRWTVERWLLSGLAALALLAAHPDQVQESAAAGGGLQGGSPAGFQEGSTPRLPMGSHRPVVLGSTRGRFSGFPVAPACNGRGQVVFFALLKTGREGIYVSLGGVARPVAEVGGLVVDGEETHQIIAVGRHPGINDDLLVAFSAVFQDGSAILTRQGPLGEHEFVADSSEAFRSFGEHVRINRFGEILFFATVDPPGHPDRDDLDLDDPETVQRLEELENEDPLSDSGLEEIPAPLRWTREGLKEKYHSGLFLDDGQELHVIGGTHRDFVDVEDGFDLNDRGLVAYRAWHRDTRQTVTLARGGPFPTAVARTSERLLEFGNVALNNRGQAAFYAEGHDGKAWICRGKLGSGLPTILAEASGDVSGFHHDVSLNEDGQVLFVEQRGEEQRLVLMTADGVRQEILQSGAEIDGHPVRTIRIGPQAFATTGQVAAHVTLEGGQEAILLLHPRSP